MSLAAYDPNLKAFLIEHGVSDNGTGQFIGNYVVADAGDREKLHELALRLWLTLDKPLPAVVSKGRFNPKGKGHQ